jgi:Nitrate and nitrite sensing/HAMP domain
MGNHGVAGARPRAAKINEQAKESLIGPVKGARVPTLRNWPVSWRLIAVIVLALLMGLVFGGLRVAAAVDSASEFSRVSTLADLGQQVTGLVQALENERDETALTLPITSAKDLQPLQVWYQETNAAAAQVATLADGVDGSFPANIQSRVATVLSEIKNLNSLRGTAQVSQQVLALIQAYSTPIDNMITLNDQIDQGTSDPGLVNDVESLNSLALAKDEAAQQRALLYNALPPQLFGDGVQQALTTAQSEELNNENAFKETATAQEYNSLNSTVAGPQVNEAQNIEIYIQGTDSLDIDQGALNISPTAAPVVWYTAQSAKVNDMQQVELGIARNIVARAQALKRSAEQDAVFTAILTAVILLLVLIATLAVARSLVLPLRRLREGALNIATVELPERVRLLNESPETPVSVGVTPIDVLSADEIGQVARAFDQVHSEAVRLASNEALLRNNFNAMFVNLSRRSQSLIERLVRMIDSLEQNEADPGRLSNLFSMDHLVTRMRRNSENLLLLAGHEGARKWSEPVLLADVARAAVSEIEQYARVTLRIQPGIRRRAPARRDHRERHDLLGKGHPGARVGAGADERRRADRGQRQRGRHSRHPAGGAELAAGQPARHRRLAIQAYGAVRRGAPGRTARGTDPARQQVPARADRPGLAAGQRHRTALAPVRRPVSAARDPKRLPDRRSRRHASVLGRPVRRPA